MERGRSQHEHAIALTNTTTTQRLDNNEIEGNISHAEGNGLVDIITGSGQDSMDESSRKESVDRSKNEFKLLWGLRKYLVLLASLAVSVTYNAGLTPPGGFWTLNTDGHHAGDPVLRANFYLRHEVFFYFNATALAASLVLLVLLLSKRVTKHELWLRSMQFTMILDLFSLMGAYAAGSCRALKTSIYVLILVIAVFVYVGIHILVSTRVIPESLKEKSRTKLIQILPKWCTHDGRRTSHQEKEVEEARKFILMLVTFVATVTYQAGLTPPGGFWSDNDNGPPPYNNRPATSVLRSNYLGRYNIFVAFNSTSFVASLVTVILLLSQDLSKHGIRSKAVVICLVVDLLCLVGAYAAGCCRDVATSIYVTFIIIIVLIFFALLAMICTYKSVADQLEKIKSGCRQGMAAVSRALSWNYGSNTEQENSASRHQGSVHETVLPAEDNACEAEHQSDGSQQNRARNGEHGNFSSHHQGSVHETVSPGSETEHQSDGNLKISDTIKMEPPEEHPSAGKQKIVNNKSVFNSPCISNTKEGEFPEEQLPSDKYHMVNTKETVSNSQHPPGNNQQSANIEDIVCNLENRSTVSLVTNVKESMSSTEHLSAINCQETTNTNNAISAEDQHEASRKDQSSSDDIKTTLLPRVECSEQNMSVSHCNVATDSTTVSEVPSVPVRACDHVDGARQLPPVRDDNHNNDISGMIRDSELAENGHVCSNRGAPGQNVDDNLTEKHLNKTRTYLLLLSILAVSLTYQSGLNPPGGFWTRSENNHLAGDRILEDTYHPRFIAFFYLNAIAFLASIVMVILLLNKMMSAKVTKRRALPIAMIVSLLSLTGAFVLGSSREAKKSISSSVLVCLVLAYVAIHVLLAICVIPKKWRIWDHESGSSAGLVLPHSSPNRTEDDVKEFGRRRNLLLILAILDATITYQAGMNPPGGVWSDDKGVNGKPGNPILQDTHWKRYDVFYYSNAISFVSSVVITILLVNKESCQHGIKSYALRVCLVAGLLGLLIAYTAGCSRNRKQSIYLIVIAVAVLVSLVIQVLLSSMHNTLGRPLSQFMGCLQSYLFSTKEVEQENTPLSPDASGHVGKEVKILKKRHKYLMLLAILAASITYQAGLNPPGGFWSDSAHHVAGNPILHDINHRRYDIFFCCNSFSFMASIVVIMLLLINSVRKKDVPLDILHLIMILDLLAIMTAFAVGSCRKFLTSIYVYVLVIVVVICILLLIVVSSGVAKILLPRRLSNHSDHNPAARTNTLVPEQ
uniref:PGG domain-containing protein n=1 Tax=Leersia perrieri TaxID=77586 RepID=A0A0D9WPE8_9ORYZ